MKDIPAIPGLRKNPPASEGVISALEKRLGISLPAEYRDFLLAVDGFSLGGGLLMYSSKEIEERNSTWEVGLYAPGYLAIGDTGAGDVILVRHNDDVSRLLIVGAGSMTPNMMRELAPSLGQWLEGGCEVPED